MNTGSRSLVNTLVFPMVSDSDSLSDMAVQLKFVLTLMGLTGVYSIITIDKVPVKLGDSVTIPCLYDSKYKNHVKYLCKGKTWSCSYAVKTDKPSSGKFSISDDRNQRIFTVTINDLTDQDTDYWCAVEIVGGSDAGKYFQLPVTQFIPSLYVDRQEITGFKGEKITISCHFRNTGRKQWCRLGGPCVTRLSGSIDGMSVTISNNRYEIFNVTMRGLTMESSGWYWCAKGELQMPVHLTVTEKPTTPTREPVTLSTSFTSKATTTVHDPQSSVSVDLESLIIPLSVLILIVMVALVIWFILKKQKHPKASSLSTMTEAEEELIYSNVVIKNKTPWKISHNERDMAVTYSSVVTTRQQRAPRVEADTENVVYSTLS